MNNITLYGRLTHDVEYGETAGGSGYARFALAVRNYSRKQEDGSPTTDFFPCVVFGDMAKTAARGMKKGGRVTVNGRIEINSYTARDGSPRMAVQVVVREFDIIDYAEKDEAENDGNTKPRKMASRGNGKASIAPTENVKNIQMDSRTKGTKKAQNIVEQFDDDFDDLPF